MPEMTFLRAPEHFLCTLPALFRADYASGRDRRRVHVHTHVIERNDLNSVLCDSRLVCAIVSVALQQRSREKREPTKLLVALFTMIYP